MLLSNEAKTGALKLSVKGNIGIQPLRALSRSQVKFARKGSRTVKSKRCSVVVLTSVAEVIALTIPRP